jgi:hypothetical protein
MKRYIIFQSYSTNTLSQYVNTALSCGSDLVGGPFVREELAGRPSYFQALLIPEDKIERFEVYSQWK